MRASMSCEVRYSVRAVVAELAVRGGLAVADAAEALAFLRQHQHAAGAGREDRAVGGDGEAVGQSRGVFADEVREVVEQLLAGDVAVRRRASRP